MERYQEDILEEKLSQLSDDELMEYKTELQKEQLKAEAPEPTTGEALSTGFVEGVPFLKDVVAGVDAIGQMASSEDPISIDSFVDKYRNNMSDMNDAINLAEEKSPYLTGAGGFAGTLATVPLAGASLGGAAAFGVVDTLSKSEDRGLSDVATGAALGVGGKLVGDKVGNIVGKGIRKTGKFLSNKADEALSQLIGTDKKWGASNIYKHLQKTGQSKEEFASAIRKMGIVEAGDDTAAMLTKATNVKQKVGKEIGNFYREVDSTYKPEIDLNGMKQRLKDDVLPEFHLSDDPGHREIGKSLESFIDELGYKQVNIKTTIKDGVKEVTSETVEDGTWGISRLHDLQTNINKRIQAIYKSNRADVTSAKEQERKVASAIGDIIDDTLDSIPVKEGDASGILGKVKNLRKGYQNSVKVEEMLSDKLSKTTDNALSGLQVNFRTLAIAGSGAGLGGPAGAIIALGLDKIIRDPHTPTYIAQGLPKVAQHLTGGLASPVVQKLVVASSLNSDKFKKTLESAIAEINLTEEPIQRSVEQSLMKSTDIEKLLKDKLPSLHAEYTDLLESNNTGGMARFLDTLSKNPKAQKFFAPGIGFDGLVYSEEDKAQLETQVRQADIPGAQRVQFINDLRANGTIPDLNKVVQAPPKQWVKSTKKVHDY